MSAVWRLALVLWLAVTAGSAWSEVPVPQLQARVTDLTGTLTPQQSGELETLLRDFEARKGSQIAVLLIPTSHPETIEQFGIRIAEQWKLGRKGVDDGILLLIAKQDRAMRLEVGYGLEGAVPDSVAKRIVAEVITPYFQRGDFFGGIRAGIAATIKVIEGEPLPLPQRERKGGGGGGDFLYVAMFLALSLASFLRALFGFTGSLLAGGVAGVLAWMVFGSVFAGIAAALITIILSFGRFWGIGFPGGGGGGGGSGFSGGGGGFGGGGASGRW